MSYFSKTVSPWCFWFQFTVTECRSRWIIRSIQTAAIVILKEQTYVGVRNVDHFKGMMKAQCWIVQKEAPMNGWEYGRKGRKKKESTFKQQIPSLSPCHFTLLTLFIFALSVLLLLLCTSPPVVSTVLILMWMLTKAFLGVHLKTCTYLAVPAAFVTIYSIYLLCP